jgi:hypothetical protein
MAKETDTKGLRIAFRVNELHPLVVAAAEREGMAVSDWLRMVVAERLGVVTPKLCVGNPEFQTQGKKKKRKKS